MLEILKNPKTENYQNLKEHIFNDHFPWFYQKTSTTGVDNIFGHTKSRNVRLRRGPNRLSKSI